MRNLRNLGLFCIGGSLLLPACGSNTGTEGKNTGSDGYHVGSGGTGSVVSGKNADETENGTASITPDAATGLLDPADTTKCTGGGAEPEGGAPPIFEFVMDASGSMGDDPANPADPNGPKKWDVFSQTMPGVFAALPANFAIGVTFYNRPNGCYTGRQNVPIAPHTAAQQTLIANAITRTSPGGYTPTYNAWKYGLDQLTAWQAPVDYTASPRYIVLITDGIPTVNRDGCTVAQGNGGAYITQAEYDAQIGLITSDPLAANVKSFFVGVVGSENPQGAPYDPLYMLSKLAVAGKTAAAGCVPATGTPSGTTVNPRGTYCHYDLSQAADFGAALSNTLGGIANSVISCDYTVPAPSGQAIDPASAVLVYNDGNGNYSVVLPNTTPGVTADTCEKGYIFKDAASTQLHICATTCTALQQNPAATLQFRLGCKQGLIIT